MMMAIQFYLRIILLISATSKNPCRRRHHERDKIVTIHLPRDHLYPLLALMMIPTAVVCIRIITTAEVATFLRTQQPHWIRNVLVVLHSFDDKKGVKVIVVHGNHCHLRVHWFATTTTTMNIFLLVLATTAVIQRPPSRVLVPMCLLYKMRDHIICCETIASTCVLLERKNLCGNWHGYYRKKRIVSCCGPMILVAILSRRLHLQQRNNRINPCMFAMLYCNCFQIIIIIQPRVMMMVTTTMDLVIRRDQ
mmetsp:Transcript_16645/g.25144  ORF Transcript_16645/g.25144 Transcript_16645/m.25144 type:complete len:250 (+) Transcript_16645:736-1485(+)